LDHHTHGQIGAADVAVSAIGQRLGREQTGLAAHDAFEDVLWFDDPQIGFLLTGERRVGQVFGGRARADSHWSAAEPLMSPEHFVLQLRRQSSVFEQGADFVRCIGLTEQTLDVRSETIALNVLAKGVGSDHETRRDLESLAQECAQTNGLTAD